MLTPILVLILLGAGGAPAAITEQRALALELVALVQPESSYRSGMEQMTDQMLPQLDAQARASGHPLPTDFKPRFISVLLEVVPYEETIEWASEIYAQRFTVPELKEMIAFYKTPLGRKLASKLPEIMGEVGRRMATVLPQRLPGALKRNGLLPERPTQQPGQQQPATKQP